jgi:hypothetical protein
MPLVSIVGKLTYKSWIIHIKEDHDAYFLGLRREKQTCETELPHYSLAF